MFGFSLCNFTKMFSMSNSCKNTQKYKNVIFAQYPTILLHKWWLSLWNPVSRIGVLSKDAIPTIGKEGEIRIHGWCRMFSLPNGEKNPPYITKNRLFRKVHPVPDKDPLDICSNDFNLGSAWPCLSSFCVSRWALSWKWLYWVCTSCAMCTPFASSAAILLLMNGKLTIRRFLFLIFLWISTHFGINGDKVVDR